MSSPARSVRLLLPALLLVLAAGSLVVYKTGGALKTIDKATSAGTLAPKAERIATGELSSAVKPLAASVNYLGWVVVALAFGVVIGALVKALVPERWLARTVAARGPGGYLAAAVLGAPLMLCSCCISPIFEGVYERSRRLGPALGLMLASPALNPAALGLTFLLFPADLAWARLALSALIVLGASAVVGRAFAAPAAGAAAACPVDADPTLGGAARAFVTALREVAVRSLPAILIGIVLSAALVTSVSLPTLAAGRGALVAVLLVAAVAVPIALPTFGEIPLALALLHAGAPDGAVVALLVAGPAINLASLAALARVVSPRVAAATGVAVYVVAAAGGAIMG